MDEWSRGAVFSLEADISLDGIIYEPAPVFAGTFKGNGHTVSGVKISGAPGEAGLFGIVTEGAEISGLTVQGSVSPQGEVTGCGGIAGINQGTIKECKFTGSVASQALAGGIAGVNDTTGVIIGCTAEGYIAGLKTTGGLAGENRGRIENCVNRAEVNTSVADGKSGLKDLKISGIEDAKKLLSFKKIHAAENTGGIAGISSGAIIACENSGTVGIAENGYPAASAQVRLQDIMERRYGLHLPYCGQDNLCTLRCQPDRARRAAAGNSCSCSRAVADDFPP